MPNYHTGDVVQINGGPAVIFLGRLSHGLNVPARLAGQSVALVVRGGRRGLRPIRPSDTLQCPAVCHACGGVAWWWTTNLRPRCRACDSPPEDMDYGLFDRACGLPQYLNAELVEAGRSMVRAAFEAGDMKTLARLAGLRAMLGGT